MNESQRRRLDEIKTILELTGFPASFITDQTAVCLLAMMDTRAGRDGLLPGKTTLHDGVRIRNILDFSRRDLDRPVAENTRESYRKLSLKPLMEAGMITAHSSSVNDPNTYYTLNPDLEVVLAAAGAQRTHRVRDWNRAHGRPMQARERDEAAGIVLSLPGHELRLSPGEHNLLIRNILAIFAPAFAPGFETVYVGDARKKMLFVNEELASTLNIVLDEHGKLPDVIFYRKSNNSLYVMEAVTSAGPVSESRKSEVLGVLARGGRIRYRLVMGTAFPDRRAFRRFVEDIAWDTLVWIADEGFGIIFFDRMRRGRRS